MPLSWRMASRSAKLVCSEYLRLNTAGPYATGPAFTVVVMETFLGNKRKNTKTYNSCKLINL